MSEKKKKRGGNFPPALVLFQSGSTKKGVVTLRIPPDSFEIWQGLAADHADHTVVTHAQKVTDKDGKWIGFNYTHIPTPEAFDALNILVVKPVRVHLIPARLGTFGRLCFPSAAIASAWVATFGEEVKSFQCCVTGLQEYGTVQLDFTSRAALGTCPFLGPLDTSRVFFGVMSSWRPDETILLLLNPQVGMLSEIGQSFVADAKAVKNVKTQIGALIQLCSKEHVPIIRTRLEVSEFSLDGEQAEGVSLLERINEKTFEKKADAEADGGDSVSKWQEPIDMDKDVAIALAAIPPRQVREVVCPSLLPKKKFWDELGKVVDGFKTRKRVLVAGANMGTFALQCVHRLQQDMGCHVLLLTDCLWTPSLNEELYTFPAPATKSASQALNVMFMQDVHAACELGVLKEFISKRKNPSSSS